MKRPQRRREKLISKERSTARVKTTDVAACRYLTRVSLVVTCKGYSGLPKFSGKKIIQQRTKSAFTLH